MFLNNPEYTKEKVKHDCITCWNPSRTLAWPKMGVDIIMGKREGYYFWDIDGKKYMNLHLNGGTFNVGHRNPEVIGAMKEAMEEFDIGNHHFGSVARGYLAKKLVETATEGMQYCIFSSCGGEAVDVAIKSARYATKRRKIVSLMKCYHGHTGLALDCGDNLYKEKFLSGLGDPDFIQVSMDDVDAMELVLKNEDVAGVIIETIPATYGFKIPAPGYIKKVKELCEKYETLYIADEVQTGLMRTGKLWAISHEDVKPDIIVTGKGLSGGIYPISATIMKKKSRVVGRGIWSWSYRNVRWFRAWLCGCRKSYGYCYKRVNSKKCTFPDRLSEERVGWCEKFVSGFLYFLYPKRDYIRSEF